MTVHRHRGRDFYAELGVSPAASAEDVRRAYRRLARECHPDVNPDPVALERFRAVADAYGVLTDPATRADYDAARTVPGTGVTDSTPAPRPHPGNVDYVPAGPAATYTDYVPTTAGNGGPPPPQPTSRPGGTSTSTPTAPGREAWPVGRIDPHRGLGTVLMAAWRIAPLPRSRSGKALVVSGAALIYWIAGPAALTLVPAGARSWAALVLLLLIWAAAACWSLRALTWSWFALTDAAHRATARLRGSLSSRSGYPSSGSRQGKGPLMGFLDRRRAPAPTSRAPAGAPAAHTSPGIARIDWRTDDRAGWLRLPDQALQLLRSAGWCHGAPLAAWAHDPATRRSRDGQHWQDIDGWWIDTETLLSVRARRPLVPAGTASDGRPRLRPSTTQWTVQLAAHQLSGPPPAVQRWSRPQQTGRAPLAGLAIRTTESAIELLPQAVQDAVGRPTGQGAIRTYPATGGYCDQVYAHRRGDGQLITVSAIREAGAYPSPDTAIDAADWHVRTHRAQVSAPAHHTLSLGVAHGGLDDPAPERLSPRRPRLCDGPRGPCCGAGCGCARGDAHGRGAAHHRDGRGSGELAEPSGVVRGAWCSDGPGRTVRRPGCGGR